MGRASFVIFAVVASTALPAFAHNCDFGEPRQVIYGIQHDDENGDGVLNYDEWARDWGFIEVNLAPDEYAEFLAERRAEFDGFDADGNGTLDLAERVAESRQFHTGQFSKIDTDADGVMTLEEYLQREPHSVHGDIMTFAANDYYRDVYKEEMTREEHKAAFYQYLDTAREAWGYDLSEQSAFNQNVRTEAVISRLGISYSKHDLDRDGLVTLEEYIDNGLGRFRLSDVHCLRAAGDDDAPDSP